MQNLQLCHSWVREGCPNPCKSLLSLRLVTELVRYLHATERALFSLSSRLDGLRILEENSDLSQQTLDMYLNMYQIHFSPKLSRSRPSPHLLRPPSRTY
jgi:hypothetical protein